MVAKENRNILWFLAGITIACIAVFYPVIGFDFATGWDDGWQVFNPYTDSWSWQNTWSIFTDDYGNQYSPINQLMYNIIHHWTGYSPACFHLASLLLHTGNALLVFVVLKKILTIRLGKSHEFKTLRITALVGFLFAVHPLQVESVAWISASKILLCSFFYLWALFFYLRYIQSGKIINYLAVILFFILSFGSKEQAVTLIVCMLWVDIACCRNFKDRKLWYEKIPVLLLTVLFLYKTVESHGSSGMFIQGSSYSLIQRIIFACYALCEYVIKSLAPVKLLYQYAFPMSGGEELPLMFWIYPFFIMLIGICFWKFWKQRPVWLGGLWFLIHIGLMIHIIPMSRFVLTADRYIYLAAPGLFFILIWSLYSLWEAYPRCRIWLTGGGIIWILLLGILSHQRVYAWQNTDSLRNEIKEIIEQRNSNQIDSLKIEPNIE